MAAAGSPNAACTPSPVIFTTRPPCASTAVRAMASWRASASRMRSGCSSHQRVLASMSVKRKVVIGPSCTSPGPVRWIRGSTLNYAAMELRTVTATRYVTPLREGGSLPAIVEGDDDGLYVLKFRGAGQGPRALIAELVSGELARALGLPVPEIVFAAGFGERGPGAPDFENSSL